MTKRRVVVTGLGLITPLGQEVETTWKAILAGKSGVASIDHFDASDLNSKICSRVKNFDASLYMPEKEARKRDSFIQYGMAAAIQAIADSNLTVTDENAGRIGLAVGSGIGGLPFIEKSHSTLLQSGPRRISPFFIPGALINMISGNLSIQFGMKGPNIALVSACTTGTHNIGLAARTIAYGDADVMVAGAAEMATTKLGIAGFAAMRALSTRNDEPEKASRPWDKGRDGFVLGDGAGVLVLEEYEHAKARGAKIYAELIGFGMSADAHHMTSPDPDGKGAAASMSAAIKDAGIEPEQIQYINAHATSTPTGDELEIKGIKRSFGEHAYRLAVSSTKSMTGHLLGAAGSVEAIFSILAIRDQVAPPTINLDDPSESCDLNLVPHVAQKMPLQMAMSNSFGFGGTNGTLIFKKPE
ncbi:MAG: beta-ketoacyl-[acyl-carrier-protein] synthase II [Gammaproteobacteria bacterium RIFCSPHIGHO2_12_FULL_43_28]|nr:MAG: beta-ketoacyl-[acyl-carrier-protein] synthase II [Gammaproteobacteria bacterium RIFCSPHIGHO2_12_FULL_43_28]